MNRGPAIAITSLMVGATLLLVAGSTADGFGPGGARSGVLSLTVVAAATSGATTTTSSASTPSPTPLPAAAAATRAGPSRSAAAAVTLAAAPPKRAESVPPTLKPPPVVPGPPVGAGVGITAAAAYATSRGYQVGVAVMDTRTGQVWGAGNASGYFASESVVKVFIAAKILVMGDMTGATETTAYKMITQSDDDSADALYGLAGGDSVVSWAASYFHVPNLGYGPTKAGWWSNAHISAAGLVEFYAAVEANPTVWPWLSNAMAHATQFGSDGTYQYFGLPSATTGWAVKQGWGQDGDDWAESSDFNSTGYVNGNRYAVAILVKGPPSGYDSATPNMVTAIAQILLPGGVCTPA